MPSVSMPISERIEGKHLPLPAFAAVGGGVAAEDYGAVRTSAPRQERPRSLRHVRASRGDVRSIGRDREGRAVDWPDAAQNRHPCTCISANAAPRSPTRKLATAHHCRHHGRLSTPSSIDMSVPAL